MLSDDVAAILEAVRGTEPTPAEVRGAAERIAALGDGAVPALLAALSDRDEDEAVLAVAAGALRRLPGPVLTHRLMGLLRSPRIGDVAKALVLGILEDHGMDIHDPAVVGTVVDLEEVLAPAPGGNGAPRPAGNGSASGTGENPPEGAP